MGHHFVLIHGGMHGAWSWFKLVDRLQKAGHKVTPIDLAGAGQHPADPNTITTFEEYNKPANNWFASLPEGEKVVLVAHSMGGLTTLQLMESFSSKICLTIFVAAVITASDLSLFDNSLLWKLMYTDCAVARYQVSHFTDGAQNPPTSIYFPTPSLKEVFYSDCDSEDIALCSILVRPFPCRVLKRPITYSKEKYGQVPSVYIRYSKDTTLPPRAQEHIVKNYGPFKEIIEIDGGHFNHWPKVDDFTKLVTDLAEKYIKGEGSLST
ncbi:hypothetical protein KC19_10G007100 [Ceratodon purpureus]|uniref:AB hydrolase-1 domain-containing protein n=2 Tax=Ceratodon purpureus TaxID=3225 RepID=A0A8T0GHV2_CERPU|nr:hypothetical protein KC19_10G007100 [Ceratodon purpureus]